MDPHRLETELLPQLGLNNENLHEFPQELYEFTGYGLFHWQYPSQFSKYLVQMAHYPIRSYLEIGVRHGGTFVITVEYLSKFHPIRKAVGIDISKCPSLVEYSRLNPRCRFIQTDSRSKRFRRFIRMHGPFDLVLIDGDHSEDGCRHDFETVKGAARILVFHDITSDPVPGVGIVWREVKAAYQDRFEFFEYTDQYQDVISRMGGTYLGIGVAVTRGLTT